DRTSKPLFLLQRIRDESHRFAINFHRNLRNNNSNKSILDSIDGIGASKRKYLLKHFGSVNKIKQASDSDIALLKGFSKKLAKKIKESI
ncbi:MAG: excinuclease ABC subunit C, partial [Chloroflexi bacterium]|nr:excinuclease ABC subunit C [Chloroflexota bacterium]